MSTIWIFDIEAHEQRYTGEWREHLPRQLKAAIASRELGKWQVKLVSGPAKSKAPEAGKFLNFADTNIYKSYQVAKFAALVQSGQVGRKDRVLFTDAWHPGVINVRYMSDLLNLRLEIQVMWHSGSYDRWDALGQAVKNKSWSYAFERAVFDAAERNYFAGRYHENLFLTKIKPENPKTSRFVGWPMEYLTPILKPLADTADKDTILFPHRLALEKQPEILKMLQQRLSEYRIIFAQEKQLSKAEYHKELARSLAVFSASKQETLGIGVFEGLMAGAVPIVPYRLSYPKMYPGFTYPSEWTMSLDDAYANADSIAGFIHQAIEKKSKLRLAKMAKQVAGRYFNGDKLYASLLR
ncbi:glycosyltransferase [Pseudooctadecabacter jejudonensis]|uniref:Glycosyl transferases group 1 n=1 Tax=Pseudooctadecabacter jejudonensis TaxID=1391910 RepID=A0A1Y5SN92_9RHOB|nr:glycosyltransferase [Pseudooctadecabacter jejudonensis]SLN41635.1 hypothetical protein PSJ8397_02094 [Pseudooctadecabacter jejudonensis]